MVSLPVPSLRVQLAWYAWYQNSSAAPECLASEVTECSILFGRIGWVPVNSAECHQVNAFCKFSIGTKTRQQTLSVWQVKLSSALFCLKELAVCLWIQPSGTKSMHFVNLGSVSRTIGWVPDNSAEWLGVHLTLIQITKSELNTMNVIMEKAVSFFYPKDSYVAARVPQLLDSLPTQSREVILTNMKQSVILNLRILTVVHASWYMGCCIRMTSINR
jgi:hypothetical protein